MTLSPWKYCTDQKIENQIKEVTKCLGIKESEIDFEPLEVQEKINEMCSSAVYEASRLYEENFAELNLPPKVQVLVMEEAVQLQSVCHLLHKKKKVYFKNKEHKKILENALKTIIQRNITLQQFLNVIYDREKEKNKGEYGFKNGALVIKGYLESFILKPLRDMGGVYGDTFNNLTVNQINQKSPRFSQEHKEWINSLVEGTESFKYYQTTKQALDNEKIPYNKYIDFVASELYKINIIYKLHSTRSINLFGESPLPWEQPN